MKYLSVCSGIEAATVAWHPLGWEPVGFSEIEKFPSAVLQHHYPDVPNYGDMLDHERWPETNVDVLVGGTPCQSFSVAGLRQGMRDPRGNLALTYLAIAEQYRPDWLVWENVPGVLSSNGGRDFGAIIGGMVELGYSPCWRVLDAQYFGVAQRRRRVFVVASSRDWRDSAQVLLEPESLLRNPAPSREARERVAGALRRRPQGSGGINETGENNQLIPTWPAEVASTMNARFADKQGLEDQHALGGASYFVPDTMGTLTARMMNALGSRDIEEGAVLPMSIHGTQDPIVSDKAHPLQAKNGDRVNAVAFAQNQRDEVRLMDKAGALAAEPGAKQQTYVAFTASDQSNKAGWESDVYPTLNAQVPNDTSNIQYGIRSNMAVRRLTPLECARLQGFPDDYFDGVPGNSDSVVYKALGNSMAVPVMRWIGERIDAVENGISS